MLAVASAKGICFLEFATRRTRPAIRVHAPVVPGTNARIEGLRQRLQDRLRVRERCIVVERTEFETSRRRTGDRHRRPGRRDALFADELQPRYVRIDRRMTSGVSSVWTNLARSSSRRARRGCGRSA